MLNRSSRQPVRVQDGSGGAVIVNGWLLRPESMSRSVHIRGSGGGGNRYYGRDPIWWRTCTLAAM